MTIDTGTRSGYDAASRCIQHKLSTTAILILIVLVATGGALFTSGQTRKKAKYIVPEDTTIRLRMNEALSSKNVQVGHVFATTVVTPIYIKGVEIIPAGSIVHGNVTHVERASRKSNPGSITVTFTSFKMPNGVSYPISGSLASSDSEDNQGEVKGKSSKKRNARFVGRGMVVGGLMNGGAGMATGGLIGAARGLIKKGEEAQINSGTEFDMILNRSISMSVFR